MCHHKLRCGVKKYSANTIACLYVAFSDWIAAGLAPVIKDRAPYKSVWKIWAS